MLHTKYEGSWPCGFKQEVLDYFMFSYLAYVNHVTQEAGTFIVPGA